MSVPSPDELEQAAFFVQRLAIAAWTRAESRILATIRPPAGG